MELPAAVLARVSMNVTLSLVSAKRNASRAAERSSSTVPNGCGPVVASVPSNVTRLLTSASPDVVVLAGALFQVMALSTHDSPASAFFNP